jgi:hypothetical protein
MENGFDPLECVGQALASHNCKIRHIPYANQDGIVSTHAYFIKRAAAVIFVMSETKLTNCGPQVEVAFTAKALTDGGPLMVVMWNIHLEHASEHLATNIVLQDYSTLAFKRMMTLCPLGDHLRSQFQP